MSLQNHITALPFELHIHIFSDLQPYDILQVSQTCKALYLICSQRMVWTDALQRICVENTLFEPSFPVANMSVLDLQHASMGPHRWIAKSSSKERNFDGVLPHSATRYLVSAMSDLSIVDQQSFYDHYLVPGGRYLFSLSCEWLVLWDLGSPYSSGREPHSVAVVSMPVKSRSFGDYLIHSTPDGVGLGVFLLYDYPEDMASLYIYEIYPESTSPQLTQIAYTQVPNPGYEGFFSVSYDRLILAQGNTLTVWDYKANTWGRWAVESEYSQVLTMKSAVMFIRADGAFVWKIPPLLPESSLSMIMSTDPSVGMSPLFELDCPTENHFYGELHQGPCDWYSGTPQPLYYDVAEGTQSDADSPLKINRFEVAINSKISGGALNLLKSFEVPSNEHYYSSVPTRICQDKNVSLWTDTNTGYLGTRVSDIYDQQLPSFSTLLFCHSNINQITFCPVSGRVIYCGADGYSGEPSITVLDF